MKKRKILTYILVILVLIAGISSVVLYKLGDRIFNEVINNQITELEQSIDQPVQTDQVEPTVPAEPSAQAPEQVPTPTSKQAANLEITKDKLEDIKESVTPKDKMEAATLVLSRLSKSDINHLTKLTTGGITPEEKAEIKAIVYSRFSQAEIEQIREMYYKYMK